MQEEISTIGPTDSDESLTLPRGLTYERANQYKRPQGFLKNLDNAMLGFFLPRPFFTQLLTRRIFCSRFGGGRVMNKKMERPHAKLCRTCFALVRNVKCC